LVFALEFESSHPQFMAHNSVNPLGVITLSVFKCESTMCYGSTALVLLFMIMNLYGVVTGVEINENTKGYEIFR
jgi:hypothetical protein